MTKTIPKKKKSKNERWLSEETLQIAEERRKETGKRERERHIQLNAESQRIARRDKKVFFNEQCKEIEENNRMGKTLISQENWRYPKNISCKKRHDKGQKW